MERVASKEEARQALHAARREGKRIGLVPTMGALHEGHLTLVRASCKRADYTAVSIFVNPTQFGEGEDFEAYPRDLERDLSLLAAEGVDLVFTPSAAVMYGHDARVTVDPGPLGSVWEGASRPGHFRGVCTIVAKLLNVIGPDLLFMGEKDYQQLKVVECMVRDLDFPTAVVGVPTVRERDGLAMSSRNAYLSPQEREQAVALCEALETAAQAVAWGERDVVRLERLMAEELAARPLASVDYVAVVDADTLERLDVVGASARAIVAAQVGSTRLIDNAPLVAPANPEPEGTARPVDSCS